MSIPIRRAIYGRMAGDTTLNALLGTPATGFAKAIYYQVAPQGASFPFVIFQKQAGTPTYTFQNGGSAFDTEVWLIKGVDASTTPDGVDAIASRLDALLTDGALTISGATSMYIRRQSDVDYAETDEGQQYRHAGALFRLLYE